MKVLVTGDREWSDLERILEELQRLPTGTIVVHGACRGADVACAEIAKALGFTVRPYPADWTLHRKAAGPIRNQQMLDKEHLASEPIDLCLAFHNDIEHSSGTADMLSRAVLAGIVWKLCSSRDK